MIEDDKELVWFITHMRKLTVEQDYYRNRAYWILCLVLNHDNSNNQLFAAALDHCGRILKIEGFVLKYSRAKQIYWIARELCSLVFKR